MTNLDGFRQRLNQAEGNARKRDVTKQGKIHNNYCANLQDEQLGQALETLQDFTGNEYYIGRKQDRFAKVEFSQVIQANMRYLVKIGYLTNAERLLLLDLSCYVEIGTHVLVEKDVTNVNKDIIKNASVTYLAEATYRTRHG
ncbi:MarR family transcriptional regulator, partial [Bacillus paranthracis]